MLVPFKSFPFIATGVRGRIVDSPARPLILAFIAADPEGAGNVRAFLDGLDAEREIIVPMVTSERLEGMLTRRGFSPEVRYVDLKVGLGLCYVRRPGWTLRRKETRTAVNLESIRSDAAVFGLDIAAAHPAHLAELAAGLERLVSMDLRKAGNALALARIWGEPA